MHQASLASHWIALLGGALLIPTITAQDSTPGRNDVVWTTPSTDASGTMPLGNGDVGCNAWVEPDGDLVFYISKTDSWSDNGRLLKVGRLRVSCEPALPVDGGFEQRLDLEHGAMVVRSADEGPFELRLWVDANRPVIHVEVAGGIARTVTTAIELWRTERTPYLRSEVSDLLEDRSQRAPGGGNGTRQPVFVEADTLLPASDGRIGWYHHNTRSVGPALIAEVQGLSDYLEQQPDPLLHRTFGALVATADGECLDDTRLLSPKKLRHHFVVAVHTEHPSTPELWLAKAAAILAEVENKPPYAWRSAHEIWWQQFWQRSWIHLEQREPAAPVPIPRNDLPVQIGIDQHGGNRFVGDIGRLRISRGCASARTLRMLAQSRGNSVGGSADRYRAAEPEIGSVPDSAAWIFSWGLTIEGWLKPGALPQGGGRILDKITPGAADGLLFDTWPGHSLRLIVGSRTVVARDVLPENEWVHVAATMDAKGRIALYVNGKVVAPGVDDDAATVERAYALQRWIDACAGRGRYPIKFNGSLFTVPHEGKFGDADYRRWGPGYWWQNTRLPYLSMCASGDFEMMRPLFGMYAEELLPLHRFRTRRYTGHGGAFLPECIYFWGPIFSETYGWTPFAERGEDKLQQSGYHKWEWVSGLELSWMMLDWYEHTLDEAFAHTVLLPAAREFVAFFEQHYGVDADGKLVMTPSQALETWWDCTGPMPEVAGLRAVTRRLLALPEGLGSDDDRALWQRVLDKTPELPAHAPDGEPMLAPATRFADKRNVENPELYAVFPFRLVSFEKDNAALGRRALTHRLHRGSSGWRQDSLFMTHLGLADEARADLVSRARTRHTGSRFPAFWGPNYDWIPDQDHGGVLMRTLQTMLMQTEGRTIHLLPAWPREWNAKFKLHAPYRTVVTGTVRDGRIHALTVEPEARRADVVIHGAR